MVWVRAVSNFVPTHVSHQLVEAFMVIRPMERLAMAINAPVFSGMASLPPDPPVCGLVPRLVAFPHMMIFPAMVWAVLKWDENVRVSMPVNTSGMHSTPHAMGVLVFARLNRTFASSELTLPLFDLASIAVSVPPVIVHLAPLGKPAADRFNASLNRTFTPSAVVILRKNNHRIAIF